MNHRIVISLVLVACGGEVPPADAPVGEISDEAISADWCRQIPRAHYAELTQVYA